MKKTILLMAMAFASLSVFAEKIDLEKSSFTWRGSKVVGSYHAGPIKMKEAKLDNGKGLFVADMTSIQDTTLDSKEMRDKLTGHLKSDDFFDVKTYPVAKLQIEKMEKGMLHGKLTVKGKTNDVKIPYVKKGKTYEGEFKFDRTKYGLIYGSKSFFKRLAGDNVIEDDVVLKFTVVTN